MDAAAIAKANNDVDGVLGMTGDTGSGQSWNDFAMRHHFDRDPGPGDSRLQLAHKYREDAVDAWRRGRYGDALDKLGKGLHCLQDYDAHMNWGTNMSNDQFDPKHNVPGWLGFPHYTVFDDDVDFDTSLLRDHIYKVVPGHTRYNHTIWCTEKYLRGFITAAGYIAPLPPPLVTDYEQNPDTGELEPVIRW